MLLAIDIGNTNIVFAVFDGEKIISQWRCETHGEMTVQPVSKITSVYVSSVVPKIDEKISVFCKKNWNIDPVFITAKNAGIAVNMDKPDEVGADRLVNAVAAVEYYQAPAIIIDFGTATTFDVVDGKATYQGGIIAPGINLSLKALEEAAAKLPKIEIKKPSVAIGKNTVDAMRAGIYFGYLGLIEGIVENIEKELKTKPFVLATGGLAPLFAGGTDKINDVDQDLTLRGLQLIYKRTL